MAVAALLLAAGASRRMGEPKPLLRWGDRTLIEWELDELERSLVDEIVVVTGARAEEVRRSLGARARYCVFHPEWPQGRATSLAAGARALAAPARRPPEAIVVQNVDQPTRAEIVDRLIGDLRSSRAAIVQPSFEGRAGHPLVLAGELLGELAAVSEETSGIRALRERHAPLLVAMDDQPVVRIDLDTPETVDAGRRLLGVE